MVIKRQEKAGNSAAETEGSAGEERGSCGSTSQEGGTVQSPQGAAADTIMLFKVEDGYEV